MRITELYRPIDVQDAYEKLVNQKKATLLAGGMFVRLQKRKIPLAIDLSTLHLDECYVNKHQYVIGAMSTLRKLENDALLPPVIRQSVKQIGGVGLRNMATIGGSVMGRYPFSDINTALLALGATLEFHINGHMTLETFLDKGLEEPDILLAIKIPLKAKGAFWASKTTYTDFAKLNLAIMVDEKLHVAIGSRPGRAKLVHFDTVPNDLSDVIARFEWGSNREASDVYRKALALAGLEDCLKEVGAWKSH